MKRKSQIFVLILLGFCLASCIKEIEEDFGHESKIVVFSYLTDKDSVLAVELLNNVPANSKYITTSKDSFPYIVDALVIIKSELGVEKQLIYDALSRRYTLGANDFKLEPGVSYVLTASTPDGRQVTSFMKMPSSISSVSFQIDTTAAAYQEAGTNGNTLLQMKKNIGYSVTFNANGDYYFVYASVFYSNYYKTATTDTTVHLSRRVYINNDRKPTQYNGNTTLTIKNDLDNAEFPPIETFSISVDSVKVFVVSAKEDYYRFLNSVEKQYNVSNDPFAEPILLYSNITGGLGVFTGLTVNSTTIKYKP